MTQNLLDLSSAPDDPYDRLIWLGGVEAKVKRELDAERGRCAFEIRLTGGFDRLLELGLYSRTRLLAWCRAENNRRGRAIRWNDGHDFRSSNYAGASTTE